MAEASRTTANRTLRIGVAAALTSTTPRMLRHYEKQGLIATERSSAGQRLFDSSVIDQVRSIRWLLSAGLPTEAIRELLDCIHDTNRIEPCAVPLLTLSCLRWPHRRAHKHERCVADAHRCFGRLTSRHGLKQGEPSLARRSVTL